MSIPAQDTTITTLGGDDPLRILVVEDDDKLRGLLLRGLQERGFVVDGEATGAEALWRLKEFAYDAVVLDVLLPDVDGFSVCRSMRSDGTWVPVLMLTALDGLTERIRGLDVGADDYLCKPFHFEELTARLRALLRRGARPRPTTLTVGDLSADPATREVSRGGRPITLTATEFSLLEYLMRHPNETHSRRRLLEHVWSEEVSGDPHVVSVYAAYLRNKIDRPFGRASLQTIRGSGYRLCDDTPG
jgi:two-component system, OmpR family, response regulator